MKHDKKIENIINKHFNKTNKEGLGYLRTEMTACISELQELVKNITYEPLLAVSLPDNKTIEQVASDEAQKDWNRLEYQKIYKGGYIDGARWMLQEVKGNDR